MNDFFALKTTPPSQYITSLRALALPLPQAFQNQKTQSNESYYRRNAPSTNVKNTAA